MYALEGTVNAGGRLVDQYGLGPTEFPDYDPCPELFCLPENAGTGSPHWNPTLPLTFSSKIPATTERDQCRVVLEGLVFRVCEIIEDLTEKQAGTNIFLSGGLTKKPFIAKAMASCLDRQVHLLKEKETTLLSVSRLSAGRSPFSIPISEPVNPANRYVAGKYMRWKAWAGDLLDTK